MYQIKQIKERKNISKICNFYDFWFKREKYGKFDTWDWVIQLGSFFHVKGDEKPHWINYEEKEVYYD